VADHGHLRKRLGADAHHRDVTDRRLTLLVATALLLVAIGVGVVLAWQSHETASSGSTSVASIATPGVCRSVNGLPDPICTPGVADPRVTLDNILSTICVSGYTTRVRPSSRFTDALKAVQIKAYGYADTRLADYEEDHLIPLELGGHPSDARNLWPEPLTGIYAATKKDGVENSLHTKVCAGVMTLVSAQTAIAKNWESVSS